MWWTKEKIKQKKEYFLEQRKNATGKFTEMVVRTYFLIYKQCSKCNNLCPTYKIRSKYLVVGVYRDFYDNNKSNYVPSVVDECVDNLKKMKYIRFIKDEDSKRWFVKIEKRLDFILDGEEEYYFNKYNISKIII